MNCNTPLKDTPKKKNISTGHKGFIVGWDWGCCYRGALQHSWSSGLDMTSTHDTCTGWHPPVKEHSNGIFATFHGKYHQNGGFSMAMLLVCWNVKQRLAK